MLHTTTSSSRTLRLFAAAIGVFVVCVLTTYGLAQLRPTAAPHTVELGLSETSPTGVGLALPASGASNVAPAPAPAPAPQLPAPTITASPTHVSPGDTATVSWNTNGNPGCSVSPSVQNGVPTVMTNTTTFTLQCSNGAHAATTVYVGPTIGVQPAIAHKGDTVLVSWDPHGNNGCTLSRQITGNANQVGSTQYTLTGQTTLSITCSQGLSDAFTVHILPNISEH